ncbi:MAG: DNA replication and repair protein RecF [Candidatus Doudnabacteria bacterium]
MRLQNISLENFRNYSKVSVPTDADLILILGENAAGKTNFLESIYFLSRLKSFRVQDDLLVRNQENYFNLSALFGEQKLELVVQTKPALKRQFKSGGQKTQRTFWKTFPVVLFVPNDLNLFHLGPVLRRKFFDETISQVDQTYVLDLGSLDHILKQKTALFEQIYQGQAKPFELDVWNQELAPVAIRITKKRQELVDFINQKLSGRISQLTGFNNQARLEYKRMFANTEEELLASLKAHGEAEVRSGKNLIGPHRDDFELQKDSQLNIYNSSRGELRAQVLALKLLQAEYLSGSGRKPIILLDDVFSELDEIRRGRLLENLSGHQIFITSTEEHHLPQIAKSALMLKVENNEIK